MSTTAGGSDRADAADGVTVAELAHRAGVGAEVCAEVGAEVGGQVGDDLSVATERLVRPGSDTVAVDADAEVSRRDFGRASARSPQ